MNYRCPVCGYGSLPRDPEEQDHMICPSCGTQFGYTDAGVTHEDLRREWVEAGARWHSAVVPMPGGWNAWEQLLQAGLAWGDQASGVADATFTTFSLLRGYRVELTAEAAA